MDVSERCIPGNGKSRKGVGVHASSETSSMPRKTPNGDCHAVMERWKMPLDVIDTNVPSSSSRSADGAESHELASRLKDSGRCKDGSKGKEGGDGGRKKGKSSRSTERRSLASCGAARAGGGVIGVSPAEKGGKSKGSRSGGSGAGSGAGTGPGRGVGPGIGLGAQDRCMPSVEKQDESLVACGATGEVKGVKGRCDESQEASASEIKRLREEVRKLHNLIDILQSMREQEATALSKERERLRCARQENDELKAELEDAKKELGILRDQTCAALETARSQTEIDVSHPSWISVLHCETSQAERDAEYARICKALGKYHESIDIDQQKLAERMKLAIDRAEKDGIAVPDEMRADYAALRRDVDLREILRGDDFAGSGAAAPALEGVCLEQPKLLLPECNFFDDPQARSGPHGSHEHKNLDVTGVLDKKQDAWMDSLSIMAEVSSRSIVYDQETSSSSLHRVARLTEYIQQVNMTDELQGEATLPDNTDREQRPQGLGEECLEAISVALKHLQCQSTGCDDEARRENILEPKFSSEGYSFESVDSGISSVASLNDYCPLSSSMGDLDGL